MVPWLVFFYKIKKNPGLHNSIITPEKCLLNAGHFLTSFQPKNQTSGFSLNSFSALWGCIKTEAVDTRHTCFSHRSAEAKSLKKHITHPVSVGTLASNGGLEIVHSGSACPGR